MVDNAVSLKRLAFNCLGNLISDIYDLFVKDSLTFYNYYKNNKSDLPFVPSRYATSKVALGYAFILQQLRYIGRIITDFTIYAAALYRL